MKQEGKGTFTLNGDCWKSQFFFKFRENCSPQDIRTAELGFLGLEQHGTKSSRLEQEGHVYS